MRLLLVEDDCSAAKYIAKGLSESGHVVDVAADGEQGLLVALDVPHDAIIADRMLPLLDGLTMVEKIRAAGVTTPILLLSALGEVDHRVEGLRAGGDDYLVKPFSFAELLARIDALIRRHGPDWDAASDRLVVGNIELDLRSQTVRQAGRKLKLQSRERRILELLMRHAGNVVTRAMLMENIWDYHFDPQSNVIDVHISRLRAKLEQGDDDPRITSVRGAGYVLTVD